MLRFVTVDGVPELAAPDFRQFSEQNVLDDAVLQFVRDHEVGLVRYAAGVNRVRLIAQVAHAYPEARIGVLVTRNSDLRTVSQQLREHRLPVSCLHGNRRPEHIQRIVVATADGIESVDVLFVWNALEALGQRAHVLGIRNLGGVRLFGMLRTDTRIAPRDGDWLQATFGDASLAVPQHGKIERPVHVVRERIDGGPTLPADLDLVGLKRQGIWRHPVRNRRIVRLAQERVSDQSSVGVRPGGVLVLVENVEHALALARRLPGWPMVTAPHVHCDDLPAVQQALLRDRTGSLTEGDRWIATMPGIERQNWERVDVLIRADGGLGLGGLPVPVTNYCEQRSLRLIDFADRHHRELRRRADSRLAAYAARGWRADR